MLLGCFVGTIVSAVAYQAILSNVILITALLIDAFSLAAIAIKEEKFALKNSDMII